MDARLFRTLATLFLYASIVLAICVPATYPEQSLRVWSATWVGMWWLFMTLLVVCDRSLFHYSFRMIGCTVVARLGCSVVIAAYVASHYHKARIPLLHDYTRGLTRRGMELASAAPVASAVVLASFCFFLYLRRREQFFTAQR